MCVLRFCLGALALSVCVGSPAKAQGVVPGGWAPEFGYQAFGNPGQGGMSFGFGMSNDPGMARGGMATTTAYGGLVPFGGGVMPTGPGGGQVHYPGTLYGLSEPVPQAVNAVDPLINAIRQSTRRPRRR